MDEPVVSVIVPAHNEERYVARCIRSVRRAAKVFGGGTEIIIVCDRCTDRTPEIARSLGARVVTCEERCIARVRNTGIAAARGRIVMTIDCDNRMTPGTIKEAVELLDSGRFVGGGAAVRFERYSVPLFLNDIMAEAGFRLTGLWCGIFWAEKQDMLAVGGFEELRAMEDAATAKKLQKYGKKTGRGYTRLRENYLINSTRKYDDLGDWLYFKLLVKNLGTFFRAALGDRQGLDRLLDELFYDYNG